jgi:hypothetical protein
MESRDFGLSPCAALCRVLPAFVAPKGQEKGNVRQEAVNTSGADRVLTKDSLIHRLEP